MDLFKQLGISSELKNNKHKKKEKKYCDVSLIPKELIVPFGKNKPWQIRKCIDLKEDIIPTNKAVTNEKNLPNLFYRRACLDTYHDSANAFVTGSGLAKSKKQFALGKLYSKATITDADVMMDSIMGTACHDDMERIGEPHEIIEVRRSMTVLGKVVSAQLDHYDGTSILSDYKFTKAFQKHYRKIKKQKGLYEKDPYVLQMNINAYLLRQDGYNVDRGQLNFWYKDYDKYTFKPDYPLARQEIEEVPIWSDEKFLKIITKIVKELSSFDFADCQQFECDYVDQWRNPPEYTIKKVGSKRSIPKTKTNKYDDILIKLILRVEEKGEELVDPKWYSLSNEEKLQEAENQLGRLYIQRKEGEPTFCEYYCPGRLYCAQYQEGYRQAKLYNIVVMKDNKRKEIQMYGKDITEALTNAQLIHKDCIVMEAKNEF